jgi:TAT (twin-arginine translocation) pathway signal sequence
MNTVSRRSFLKTAGVATGAAAISASPAAAAMQPGAIETTPSGPLPHEPIVAIIRDAGLGEVTVLSGRTEKTYRDKVLVRRLLKAAGQNQHPSRKQEVA